MNGYEITLLVFIAINLLASSYMHGKEKDGRYNFFVQLASSSISFWLMYSAGLFHD